MLLEQYPDVRRLSTADKLILVSELWDDLAEHPSEVRVSRAILEELYRRMEQFRQNPGQFTTWEAVLEKVLGRRL